jgi:acetylornithine/succinyldiaminopimelate/putrescine aminotransferase/predicted amino acid dehydrogenase
MSLRECTMPQRTELLRLAKLDKTYDAGEGDRLVYYEAGQRQEVIDFVGGFGTNLLGHRHREVQAAAMDFICGSGVYLSDQGSNRPGEQGLAYILSTAVGRVTGEEYVVRLGSTGAEAVEMALAHACLERHEKVETFIAAQRREFGAQLPDEVARIEREARRALRREPTKVLALQGGFHGKTIGARALLWHEDARAPFTPMMGIDAIFLPVNGDINVDDVVNGEQLPLPALRWADHGQPAQTEFHFSRIVAAVAEPIQGEGGICQPNRELLKQLGRYDFPLVFDEIQCGLGRSGSFVASAGLDGDYYLFAKALGGGIAKVSALLVDRRRYVPRFDELYSSTFAGDSLSCAVAKRVLEIIHRDDIPARARERGASLKGSLEKLRQQYPDVIKAVTGQGLMLGIEFRPEVGENSLVLRQAEASGRLGLAAASYLLNRHHLRLLPTLSAPNVLRVEPSAYIDDGAITALCRGLARLCLLVRNGETKELVEYLSDEEPTSRLVASRLGSNPPRSHPTRTCHSRCIAAPHPGSERVLFVSHYTSTARDMAWSEPDLGRLAPPARKQLFRRLGALTDYQPLPFFAHNMFGNRVWFLVIALPFGAVELEAAAQGQGTATVLTSMDQALAEGAARGCRVGVLGGFNSIVARNGTVLTPPPGMRLSTGNSLTVAVAVRRLQEACANRKIDLREPTARVGIVGATGNIGASIAEHVLHVLPELSRVTLVSRKLERLQTLRNRLLDQRTSQHKHHEQIDIANDPRALRDCNVIVVATATGRPIIGPQHLASDRPVVVADISLPSSIMPEARTMPNLHLMALGGTVTVPGHPEFDLAPQIGSGSSFCCAAEGMLLGLEPERTSDLRLTGAVAPSAVQLLSQLAEDHGFFDKLGEGDFRSRAA